MNPFPGEKIFEIEDENTFLHFALEIFQQQAKYNPVYKEYLQHLNIHPQKIKVIEKIPFLPIQFFKSHTIISGLEKPQIVFTSSGTTGENTSKHLVTDIDFYEQSFLTGFHHFYGKPSDYYLLALLPSYHEREGSSLIYMCKKLIEETGSEHSGFYLKDIDKLTDKLKYLIQKNDRQIILLGVSFALLDLAEKLSLDLHNVIIMETGGMKGRKKEMIREELHHILCEKLNVQSIHSEYGMTELLSQAYSKGNGIFSPPPWMKIFIRNPYDPFRILEKGKSGGINIIDLANLNSCSFIETQDLGRITGENQFEVLGRFDNSDIRGCNLLVE
ncbi:MAG: acyl transferase [Bacteroidetes bacterium]|nr:MAG: acyl transferase [Bacteroidota bacterium]